MADSDTIKPGENRRVLVGHRIKPEVVLYCDGECDPPEGVGTGGWSYVLVNPITGKELHGCGSKQDTTNYRMEIMAVIEGLKKLKRPCNLEIVCDSMLLLNGMSEWRFNWKRLGWRRKTNPLKGELKNADLWQEVDRLLDSHTVKYTWVRSGTGDKYAQCCHVMAKAETRNTRR
jgi:ribonuclease HI